MTKYSPGRSSVHVSVDSIRRAIGAVAVLVSSLIPISPTAAQTTGRILGTVRDASTDAPLASADVTLEGFRHRVQTNEEGRFILVGVPPGERSIRIEAIAYRAQEIEGVLVRSGQAVGVEIRLVPRAMELEGVLAEVDRIRLIEPEISATHEVILGEQLLELPLDAVEEAVELVTGVTDGHFRGGRAGQEVYVVDGVELKNQFDASTQGLGFELPPTALDELEVITGGIGAQYGSALSGVVRYQTRRGDPHQWNGIANLRTDHWAPDAIFRGFTALGGGAGGPVSFLGEGTTLRGDLLLQAMQDSDPRARGLTCLQEGDGLIDVDALIRQVRSNPGQSRLHCPFTSNRFPHQRGEKLLGFLRLDRPVGREALVTGSVLWNRLQRQLYTPDFKYNPDFQLGQRTKGLLGTLALDWSRQGAARGLHVVSRVAAARLDRHLGTLDPWTFDERRTVFGYGLSDYRFLGEDFTRLPLDEQLRAGTGVSGYLEPGGSTGSPFGPAAEGIFFTEGTPGIANWSRSEFLNGEVEVELQTTHRHEFRIGAAAKLFRIETYERVQAYDPASAPVRSSFDPATFQAFAETSLAAAEDFTIQLGIRMEGFRTGGAVPDAVTDSVFDLGDEDWNVSVMPRIGVSGPIPNSWGTTVFRFNYALVTQAPDFQFFVDTSIGDSLRTSIRRQGNPDLAFERGTSWEFGVSHVVLDETVAFSVVGFRKDLTNLVSGNLPLPGFPEDQFTTGDFGTVQGLEFSVQGRVRMLRLRAGYALQWADGVANRGLDDENRLRPPPGVLDPGRGLRVEFPLAFDRRHAFDLGLFVGRAAGSDETPWGAAFIGSLKSGFPADPRPDAAPNLRATFIPRFPWTHQVDVRVSRSFGSPPGCARCRWRILADVRNAYGRDNVIGIFQDTRALAPLVDEILELATPQTIKDPIPRESDRYSPLIDQNGDGLIDQGELSAARVPAALDRFDPSLFFGEAFQLRLGVEVTF